MRRVLAFMLAGAACTPGGGADDQGDAEATGDGSTTDPAVPEPAFLNPAVGEFLVRTDQTVPEPFVVQRVVPGLTQVLLDSTSIGALDPGSLLGSITETSLELAVHGALVAGTHTLQLVNPGPDGPRTSVTLMMVIEPPPPEARPTFTHALTATDLTGIDALLSTGVGQTRMLGLLGPGDPDPVLRLLRADGDGWGGKPVTVPLDGHVPDAMSFGPAVAAAAFPDPDGGPPERMRVVWRVGMPGHTLAAREIAANPTPIVLDTFPVFDRDDALAGEPVEWSAFGRPFLLGETLLAELVATADTEVPHPGDRRIYSSFWRGDELRWTTPQRIGMPSPIDLDALGPATRVPDLSVDAGLALSVRLGGAFPGMIEARDDGAVSISAPTLTAPLALSGDLALTTLASDFGARTVAAVDRNGRVTLAFLDTSGDNPPRAAELADDTLPDAAPTAAPTAAVALGFTVWLVPYGDAAPVHLVLADGQDVVALPLTDPEPLHCDAVHLATTLAGNSPDDPAVPLACLSHGALALGHLRAAPPD